MIKERLLTPEYYYRLLTLLLKETNGVPKQIDLYTSVIKTQDKVIDNIFDLLGVEDNGFYSVSEENSSILDQVGKIVGVSRDMYITYTDQDTNTLKNVQLNLDNKTFKALIYYTIIKNNYNGSRKDTEEFYGILANKFEIPNIEMSTIYNDETQKEPSGICYVYYNTDYISDSELTENNQVEYYLQRLFLGGYFTLKSIGITYNYSIVKFKDLLYWDSGKWDTMIWG